MEDINEKVSGYGIMKLHILRYVGNLNIQICVLHPNCMSDWTETLNIHLWYDDPTNEIYKTEVLEIVPPPLIKLQHSSMVHNSKIVKFIHTYTEN